MGKGNIYIDLLRKQQRRIKRFIKNAERRGFIFDDNVLPKTPKKPTKASVDRLKKLTPEKLYKKAKYKTPTGDTVSGTKGRQIEKKQAQIKRTKGRQIEKKQSQIKGTKTHDKKRKSEQKVKKTKLPRQAETIMGNVYSTFSSTAYEQVRDEINNWSPPPNWSNYWIGIKTKHKNYVESILNNAVAYYGFEEVARRLENRGSEIGRIISSILYGSKEDVVQFDLNEFTTILNGGALEPWQSAIITEFVEGVGEYENTPI